MTPTEIGIWVSAFMLVMVVLGMRVAFAAARGRCVGTLVFGSQRR